MSRILWKPSEERVREANVTTFLRSVEERWGLRLEGWADLYDWSIREPERFWQSVWSHAGVISESRGDSVLMPGAHMSEARWFPDARLSFARNLLRRRDQAPAIVFRGEHGARRSMSFAELYDAVAHLARALAGVGVASGDVVAGYLPNIPEAVVAMLAATSLGAVWSSCSPDFGVRGVLDRFGQVRPKVLFAADAYHYAGRTHDVLGKLPAIREGLPSVERLIVVPYVADDPSLDGLPGADTLRAFLAPGAAGEIPFASLPFNHPLYVMFSSGTTGVPKCIVHGAGGTLLQHLKEHRLHVDIRPGDRVFYFTTTGWMMWNWLVSSLASEATILLYDGSPFHPDGNVLFDIADEENMAVFGTSAKYIDALAKAGLEPRRTHELRHLRVMLSTGSPLAPESFDFVYEKIKADLCLSSISGGTDIVSCFALGSPVLPVRRGELQCRGLAMKVEVFDDEARPVRARKGELVCTAPFPAMPLGFADDPDGERFRSAYFERFPGVWHHGDYVELTASDGMIFHGRSDAVLNPGGVRIGTAEIYRQVEQLDEVVEALAIGQDWEGDQRVVLFLRLREGHSLDRELRERIRERIRQNATPRHVPAKIVQVADIPRTKSGKIVELAVREVVHGRPVKNREALANPEALDLFRDLEALREP